MVGRLEWIKSVATSGRNVCAMKVRPNFFVNSLSATDCCSVDRSIEIVSTNRDYPVLSTNQPNQAENSTVTI